jgi:pimeloyl-ACP methyl ester carboxylesterase
MGGMIAQEFALRYPKHLKNLILGCTSYGGPRAVQMTPDAMAFLYDPERANQSEEEKALSTVPWLCNQDFIDNNPAVFKRFIAIFTEYPTPPHSLVCQMNVLMTFDSYDRLPQITAPTLVICGAEDRLIPSGNSNILASRIPGAELAIIENAEHAFITDSVDKSTRIILQFLKKHSKHGCKTKAGI